MAFCGYLQANTAVDVLIGPFVDDTDGKTPETGLTISQADVKLSKNGQTLAQKNDNTACAADSTTGYYNCELDATDTNTEGMLSLIVNESGALPVRHDFLVISQAAYASIVTAKDTGYMDVNVKAVSEDTAAADNLETACDNYSATRGLAGTALPAAAADAAGGLIISDTGGLAADTLYSNVAAILADTGTDGVVVAAGSKTGYSLTATTGLGNQTANITGNLSGSVGSVTGAVGSVTGAVGSVTAPVLLTPGTGTGQISLTSGAVTAGTVADKGGYSLVSTTGLGNQTANITGNLSGSVGSVTGAVGSVTGAVGSIGSGGITSASFASGAINAAAIAADAIGASELATDAVTEIANAVAALTVDGVTLQNALKLILAAAAGKVSGADGTTIVIRDTTDTYDRITATVDQYGNRSAVSYVTT